MTPCTLTIIAITIILAYMIFAPIAASMLSSRISRREEER